MDLSIRKHTIGHMPQGVVMYFKIRSYSEHYHYHLLLCVAGENGWCGPGLHCVVEGGLAGDPRQVIRRGRCWHDCMFSRLITNMEKHRRNVRNKSSGAEMKWREQPGTFSLPITQCLTRVIHENSTLFTINSYMSP